MYKTSKAWVRLFVLIVVIAPSQFVRSQENPNQTAAAAERTQRETTRLQAISSIKGAIIQAGTLGDKAQMADVIAAAAEALLPHDRQFSANTLNQHIVRLLNDYASLSKDCQRSAESIKECHELDRASRILIGSLARFDTRTGRVYQDRLFEIRNAAAADRGRNTNEAFELALNGLDADQQATLRSIGMILRNGVPSQFPAILYRLRRNDPVSARLLLDLAIVNIHANSPYSLTDVITVSTAVFSEPGLLEPDLRDPAQPNDIGIFTAYIGYAPEHATADSIVRFVNGSVQLLSRRLQGDHAATFNAPSNLLKAFFLCHKIRIYAETWEFSVPAELQSVIAEITSRMQIVGFSSQTRETIAAYAIRLASENNPLQLSDGDDLLERADKEKDPEKKLAYLIRAIVRLIESKRFAQAERHIFDVSRKEEREALYTFLHFRRALASAEDGEMLAFDRYVNQVSDTPARSYLLLYALDQPQLTEFDRDLIKNKASIAIDEISDPELRASASVILYEKLLKTQPGEAQLYASKLLKNVNAAPLYYQDPFRATIKIPGYPAEFVETMGSGSFRRTITELASVDWSESQLLTSQLKSKPLEFLARVYSATSVLNSN